MMRKDTNRCPTEQVREVVLQKASEDFAGLWEIIPSIRSIWDGTDAELLPIAKATLTELLEGGLIEFFWGTPDPDENWKLGSIEVCRVLDDVAEWDGNRPLAGRLVWIGATPAGDEQVERR